ncbi:hypothetical protein C1Y63_11635 [Corynebacterium sp. 13CS0277]|uniref:hypothetical protein n=1 Tax=Corynebacterium sp. 13CS0277 TaxID=2071994 RepID=UPI000D0460B4|nr:hypothetical protein [Corynebacterium sp. 13CS0277]PRQ10409.1 hypothetical protein C1Y63_11635 [Corynebacterium sp. 13CS0277]
MATTFSVSLHGVTAAEMAAFVDMVTTVHGSGNAPLQYNPAESTLSYTTPAGHTVPAPSVIGDSLQNLVDTAARGRVERGIRDLIGEVVDRLDPTKTAETRPGAEDSFGSSWFSTPDEERFNNGYGHTNDRRHPFADGGSTQAPDNHPFEKPVGEGEE